uniref:Uncharacterized protein n=1 Tax=Meloidogyne incognita TaxID=6306 RepID=A0A914MCR2_MELIC
MQLLTSCGVQKVVESGNRHIRILRYYIYYSSTDAINKCCDMSSFFAIFAITFV